LLLQRVFWAPIPYYRKFGPRPNVRRAGMRGLITLLEKVVFFLAGAVIIFLAYISRSNAEYVDVEVTHDVIIGAHYELDVNQDIASV
jgi:hypothetical protein